MTNTKLEDRRSKLWRTKPGLVIYTANELAKFVNHVGIALIRTNEKFPLPSLLTAINGNYDNHSQISKNELKPFLDDFFNTIHRTKQAVEVISFDESTCVVSEKVFINLYALQIERSSKNSTFNNLPIKRYTRFERELYEIVHKEGPVSRKSLILRLNLTTRKSRKLLDQTLNKLWKKIWIIRVSKSAEGNIWKATSTFDKQITKKALSIKRNVALDNLIVAVINSSVAITRHQIRQLLKNISSYEEVDETITSLILKNVIQIDPSVIIHGKKALTLVQAVKRIVNPLTQFNMFKLSETE
ncbi:MAG: hypothetical protein KJ963_07890 [Bacteroidetes bacterium]|nr:hypothetical protein [Bacteroidota bacterium]